MGRQHRSWRVIENHVSTPPHVPARERLLLRIQGVCGSENGGGLERGCLGPSLQRNSRPAVLWTSDCHEPSSWPLTLRSPGPARGRKIKARKQLTSSAIRGET